MKPEAAHRRFFYPRVRLELLFDPLRHDMMEGGIGFEADTIDDFLPVNPVKALHRHGIDLEQTFQRRPRMLHSHHDDPSAEDRGGHEPSPPYAAHTSGGGPG